MKIEPVDEVRSHIMRSVKSSRTGPELIVRKMLRKLGIKFKGNVPSLEGRPDIVIPSVRTVIFIHGCFWHRHLNCRYASMPKTRVKFWADKFLRNVERDKENVMALRSKKWKVIVVWQCEQKNMSHLERRLIRLLGVPLKKMGKTSQ